MIIQIDNVQISIYNNIQMQIESEKKFSYLDEFRIIKTLGAGYHAQVKLGVDQHNKYVAIKRYKKQTANLKTLQHELNIMKQLDHENLVKLIDVRQNATYKSRNETTYQCFAIIIEYVGGGELFDYIADTGKFSEKVARTYFHQMMNALHYMHSKGYAHRDIKPENILLSSEFVLKLADFGFSCLLKGKDNTGILHTKLGTQGYMAPQIPTKNYQGDKTDVFAAGVILFIMYAGNPPFQKAAPNDPYYKLLKQKNYNVFWSAHARRRPPNYFSDSFKDLFSRMVAFDPAQRITIKQISQHPWINEPICTYKEIKEEFTQRQVKLDKVVQARRSEEQKKKQQRMKSLKTQGTNSRGDCQVEPVFFEAYTNETDIVRKFPPLEPIYTNDIVVNEEAPYVISSLKELVTSNKIELQESNQQQLGSDPMILKLKQIKDENGDKIIVELQYKYGTDKQQESQTIGLSLTFGEYNKHLVVRVERQSGNQLYFKKIVREIKNQLSYCTV